MEQQQLKQQAFWLKVASLVGFSAVALGAFGAHGLKEMLTNNGMMENYKTGVLYHLVHAAVLLAVVQGICRKWERAALFFTLGILIFSGSLYIMAVTEIKKLGMITPIGGTFLLLGWLVLFFGAFSKGEDSL